MDKKGADYEAQELISNALLYLSLLVAVSGFAFFGLNFFENAPLLYGSQLLLIASVILPFFPIRKKSFEMLMSRSAIGLFLTTILSGIEIFYHSGLKMSTILTSSTMALLFLVSTAKVLLIKQKIAIAREMLELIAAGLTAFGAIFSPIASRIGLQSPDELSFVGIPIIIFGLILFYYSRYLSSR